MDAIGAASRKPRPHTSNMRSLRSLWLIVMAAGPGCRCDGSESTTGQLTSASGIGATSEGDSEDVAEAESGASETTISDAPSPGPGPDCEPPAGAFADCLNVGLTACGDVEAACLVNNQAAPQWGACFRPCTFDCECWTAPEDGSAVSRCAPVLMGDRSACVLDCGDDRSCPPGSRCLGLTGTASICVYDADAADSATDGTTDSATDGSGD